jgi:hypothetical protein
MAALRRAICSLDAQTYDEGSRTVQAAAKPQSQRNLAALARPWRNRRNAVDCLITRVVLSKVRRRIKSWAHSQQRLGCKIDWGLAP